MAVVGGSAINTSFLDAGLPKTHPVIPLRLTDVQKFDSGAVWMKHRIQP